MHRLKQIGAGLTLALASTGCMVIADGVAPGDPLDAHMVLTWTIEDAPTGRVLDCRAAGTDTVRVVADNLDTYETFYDPFDCAAGGGTTEEVTAGNYEVRVQLVDCWGPSCAAPDVYATVRPVGTLAIFRDQRINLGHVVFEVED
jgi:hypothetical protein